MTTELDLVGTIGCQQRLGVHEGVHGGTRPTLGTLIPEVRHVMAVVDWDRRGFLLRIEVRGIGAGLLTERYLSSLAALLVGPGLLPRVSHIQRLAGTIEP